MVGFLLVDAFVGRCPVLRFFGLLWLLERSRLARWVLGLFVSLWLLFFLLVVVAGVAGAVQVSPR